MRYYLIVPKLTFLKIKDKIKVKKEKDKDHPVDYYKEEDNKDFDKKSKDLLDRFSRIHSRDWDTIRPKSLCGGFTIIEVELDGDSFTEEELLKDLTKTAVKKLKIEDKLDKQLVERNHLERQIKNGDILDYGHYPHYDEEDRPCIHCYLDKNRKDWSEPLN